MSSPGALYDRSHSVRVVTPAAPPNESVRVHNECCRKVGDAKAPRKRMFVVEDYREGEPVGLNDSPRARRVIVLRDSDHDDFRH
jgi:hypothetical protein